MSTLTATNPTILDLAKASDPDGKIAVVAEILNEVNEVLDDMSWVEGNLPTGHRSTLRADLPSVGFRKLNSFTSPAKSTTGQVTFNTAMLEAYAEVDKALADLNGNTAAYRMTQDRAFIEAMSQKVANSLFYGYEGTTPEGITGIAQYFNSLSANNGDNIIDASASNSGGDNQSIYLVGWGPNTVHGIVPKGSKAGLTITDKGVVTVQDTVGGTTGRMEAYLTHYRWDIGLAVPDWRYIVRIANIDKSNLTRVYTAGAFSSGANLPDLMFQAMRKVPNLGNARFAFYMSRDLATWVARQTAAMAQGSTITTDVVAGDRRFTERFAGIPMRRVDELSANEATVA